MKKQTDNTANISIREQIWQKVNFQLLDKYHFHKEEKILFLKLSDTFKISTFLETKHPGIAVDSINLNSPKVEVFDEDKLPLPPNHYSFIFAFLPRHLLKINKIPSFAKNCYYTLKTPGRCLVAFSTHNTSSTITYNKVIESGAFPELSPDIQFKAPNILDTIDKSLKDAEISPYHFSTEQLTLELPDLHHFEQYLYQTAYLYKKVLPKNINDAVIQQQVKYFDDICQKKYRGKYIFEYEIHTVCVTK